jgi:hypothetical protein
VTRHTILWCLGLLLFVAATNRYADPRDPGFSGPSDTYLYLAIAHAAPGLPDEPLGNEVPQRLAAPYAIGLVSNVVPVPLHRLFQATALVMSFAILLIFGATLEACALRPTQVAAALALLAFDPWLFRLHLMYPEMIDDLGFALGMAIMLHGLVKGSVAGVLSGQVIASLSRQTGLVLIPWIALWVWRDRRIWAAKTGASRIGVVLGAAALVTGVYFSIERLTSSFAGGANNISTINYVVGLFTWLKTDFDVTVLVAFLLRALLAVAVPLAILVGAAGSARFRAQRGMTYVLLCGTAFVAAQPFLAGPYLTGGNAPRLISIGVLPLLLAAACAMRDTGVLADGSHKRVSVGMLALLAVASMHHAFAVTLLDRQDVLFLTSYALACLAAFALVRAAATSMARI